MAIYSSRKKGLICLVKGRQAIQVALDDPHQALTRSLEKI